MILENINYVPTLAIRASEMNGLEFLPGATKDRMLPCFLLAPWANSNSLEKSVTRIERAFSRRHYFLDVDRDYQLTNADSPAQQELQQLKEPNNCFENWVAFVAEHEWIWPCIQTQLQSERDIVRQIEAFQKLGRSYCLRISQQHFPNDFDAIVRAFAVTGTADFAIILEGGWTNDPLTTIATWFSGLIAGALQAIDASVPIVISFTSMPKMFDKFNGMKPVEVPFSNRQLVEQLSRQSNRARVVYGDWASTRPRERSDIASRPLDRVDYPTLRSWNIARNKKDGWDFRDAARAVVGSSVWDGNLGIWGEQLILNTTINKELGIDTPQKNVSARVNIHLHRQAFFGQPPIDPSKFEDEWED